MSFVKRYVVCEGMVYVDDSNATPEHPIYIPIVPPTDTGLHPEQPIYFPVGIWGGSEEPFPTPPIFVPGPPSDAHPEHPIYYPIVIEDPIPTHPIVIPPELELPEAAKEKLKAFLFGNLPNYVAPM